MKPSERQARILEIVGNEGEAAVDTLAEMFDVSLETIRRDLQVLASTGALHKVRGGARRIKLAREGSFGERMFEHAAAKSEIGRKLSEVIEDGDTLFMDTGTTTFACAEALAKRDRLTVITNSLRVAQRLGDEAPDCRLYLLGGNYAAGNSQTVGPMVIEQISRFQAVHAVVTVAAIDAEAGATDADFDEAQVARAMIEHARNTIVLAHAEKFGRRAAFSVCRLSEINMLVSERKPEGALASALAVEEVQVR